MRRVEPEFFKRVSYIRGDCGKPDLGINEHDRALLIQEVNFIFHTAASAKFDDSLREATNVNVRATRDLLHLAEEIENLKVRKPD